MATLARADADALPLGPPAIFSTLDVRAIIGKPVRVTCAWRGFWIFEPGRVPVRLTFHDRRKDRKLP